MLFSELASEDGDEIEFEDEAIGQNPDVLLDQQETNRLIMELNFSFGQLTHGYPPFMWFGTV